MRKENWLNKLARTLKRDQQRYAAKDGEHMSLAMLISELDFPLTRDEVAYLFMLWNATATEDDFRHAGAVTNEQLEKYKEEQAFFDWES